MSRSTIIKKLKEKNPNLSYNHSASILDIFFNAISNSLNKKKTVEIRSFGTFFIKTISEKKSARNPKTAELIYVPEKNKVRFKASKKLNKLINE